MCRAPAVRRLGGEQSNTSVIYGDQYILKLFRRIAPGPNPDLELSLALARAGSQRIAAPAAWFEAVGIYDEPATLGVLQHYLPASADGWALALQAVDEGSDFTPEAYALGQATAEVHDALARALPTAVLRWLIRRMAPRAEGGVHNRLAGFDRKQLPNLVGEYGNVISRAGLQDVRQHAPHSLRPR